MFKNLKIPAVECLENGNYHVNRKLFPAKQHFFKWIPEPENCKNQETNRIKSKKIKLDTNTPPVQFPCDLPTELWQC